MNAKKLPADPPVEYLYVEQVDRALLGRLQFQAASPLRIYFDSQGRMVVRVDEYNEAIKRQRGR